jgi:hypothetical protein
LDTANENGLRACEGLKPLPVPLINLRVDARSKNYFFFFAVFFAAFFFVAMLLPPSKRSPFGVLLKGPELH